jgi:hypothetical protein
VGAQQPRQFGRDGDGAGLVVGAVLQAAFLPRGAVVGPGGARPGGASYLHVAAVAAEGSLTLPTATYSLDEAAQAWEAQASSPGK